ncbi:hypothetical protein COCCADRAFT_101815, partial [Bipolaris zeicola 26-R-13]
PLNIAYFRLLKRKYSNVVLALVRNRTNYISKDTFLLAFRAALKQDYAFFDVFTSNNCKKAFKAVGLVPLDA